MGVLDKCLEICTHRQVAKDSTCYTELTAKKVHLVKKGHDWAEI